MSETAGEGPIDWETVKNAATIGTEPGSIDLTEDERIAYRDDVSAARSRITRLSGVDFDIPNTVQIQNRHHWIATNASSFERIMEPLANKQYGHFSRPVRTINTGTMTLLLSVLGNNVLGQYDPLLLAEGTNHGLYFVHPNIEKVANELDVDVHRFRRWIVFHEVTHAAEFGAAPWLSDHLEHQLREAIEAIAAGTIDRDAFREMDATMTAVEGYAELLMDDAFDQPYDDLREKLDKRRRQIGPVGVLLRRILGLNVKRRQYLRGKAFFETIVDEYGLATAGRVWDEPAHLPRWEEYDHPTQWIHRIEQ